MTSSLLVYMVEAQRCWVWMQWRVVQTVGSDFREKGLLTSHGNIHLRSGLAISCRAAFQSCLKRLSRRVVRTKGGSRSRGNGRIGCQAGRHGGRHVRRHFARARGSCLACLRVEVVRVSAGSYDSYKVRLHCHRIATVVEDPAFEAHGLLSSSLAQRPDTRSGIRVYVVK
jgi:hypothetical protein